MKKRERK